MLIIKFENSCGDNYVNIEKVNRWSEIDNKVLEQIIYGITFFYNDNAATINFKDKISRDNALRLIEGCLKEIYTIDTFR